MTGTKYWLAIGLSLLLAVWSPPLQAQSFSTIQLNPRTTPEGWENARRYEIGYFSQAGDALEEVDLPNQVKYREIDLILAGVVKELLAKEFDPGKFKVDNQQVASTTAADILDLVATSFPSGSPGWSPAHQTILANYLQNFPHTMMLYKMEIHGTTEEGAVDQTIPLILRLKQTPAQPDLLSLFFVTTRKATP